MRCCNNNNTNNLGNERNVSQICYCSRFVDVPMQVIRGQGYSEIDCCEDTLEVLQEISNTLKRSIPTNENRCCHNNCCRCNCCHCNCHCNRWGLCDIFNRRGC